MCLVENSYLKVAALACSISVSHRLMLGIQLTGRLLEDQLEVYQSRLIRCTYAINVHHCHAVTFERVALPAILIFFVGCSFYVG